MTNKSTERIYRIDERQFQLDRTDRMILGAIDDSRRSGDGSRATTSEIIAYGQDMYGESETPTSMTVRRHMDSLADNGLVHTYQLDEHPSHPSRKPPRAAKLLPLGLSVIDEIGASLPQAETGLTERTRSVEQELRDVRDDIEELEGTVPEKADVVEIKRGLDDAFEELDRWKQKVNRSQDDIKSLKRDSNRLDRKVAQQAEQIGKLQSQLESVESTQEDHESYIDDVQEWTNDVHGRLSAMEERLKDVEAGVEHWRGEWDTWLLELRERTREKTPGSMFSLLKSD